MSDIAQQPQPQQQPVSDKWGLQDWKLIPFGFSPRRMSLLLNLTALGFFPYHFFDTSCEESEGLGTYAFVSMLAVGILTFVRPASDKTRANQLLYALLIFLLHSLFVH